MSRAPLRVAVLGAGTVGREVVCALRDRAADLTAADGAPLALAGVAVRDIERARTRGLPADLLTDAPAHLVASPETDVVVELMGGDEPARTLIAAALGAGKAVVTANKHVIAHHGPELERVPQLLDGNPHVVKTIGKVQPRRMVNGGGETTCTPRRPLMRPCDSLDIARGLLLNAFARHRNRALPYLLNVEVVEPLPYVFLETTSFVGNGCPQPVDGRARNIVALFELIENEERDVEFASRTEQSREASDTARHLLRLASSAEQGESRPQTTGRNPCLVERLRVAILGGRQRTSERRDALTDEVFGSRSTHNYGGVFPVTVPSL